MRPLDSITHNSKFIFIIIHLRWHGENQNIVIHVILVNNFRNSSSKYATILKIGFMKEHMEYHGIINTYQQMEIIMGDRHI